MKFSFSLTILAILIFMNTCKNELSKAKRTQSTTTSTDSLQIQKQRLTEDDRIEEGLKEKDVEALSNNTDEKFDQALYAFEEGDSIAAADYVNEAIEELREEAKRLQNESDSKMNQMVHTLMTLERGIRKGTVTDIQELENVFAQTEMTAANNYMVFANIYALDDPEKSKNALQKAIEKMENASFRIKGDLKIELKTILAESQALFTDGVAKTREWEKATGDKIVHLSNWLKAHKKYMLAKEPINEDNIISKSELPRAVIEAIEERFPNATFTEYIMPHVLSEKEKRSGSESTYLIKLKNKEGFVYVTYTEQGKFLYAEGPPEDNEEEENTLDQDQEEQ